MKGKRGEGNGGEGKERKVICTHLVYILHKRGKRDGGELLKIFPSPLFLLILRVNKNEGKWG